MKSRGFVGEDLTQRLTEYRDIDKRLTEDLGYLRHCLALAPREGQGSNRRANSKT